MERARVGVVELFFLLILAGLSYGFFVVMQPFLVIIFLAAVFSSVLYPAYERLSTRLGGRTAAAGVIMVLLVLVVVSIPVSIVTILVYSEAVTGYAALMGRVQELAGRLNDIRLLAWAQDLPVVGDYLHGIEPVDLSDLLRQAVRTSTTLILSATQQSFVSIGAAVAGFLLTLLLMFFLFQSGRRLISTVYSIIPMPNRELREIADETRRTTTATLTSTLLIGLMEGLYGAILFLIFGLPSPVIWGILIMVLSMIPLIGTNLVLVPAGVILIASGRVVAGVLMIVLGLGGVAITQNVVRPKLLGDRSGLHPALALLSTIGGIMWLGVIGFLIGPLVASLFIVIWRQFALRYRRELDARDTGEPTVPG